MVAHLNYTDTIFCSTGKLSNLDYYYYYYYQ